jgi:hypothetical protein
MPTNREVFAKNNVGALIARTQEDAMRKLRQAGVPEAHVLQVMQRISVLCLQALRELDRLYQQFEEIVMEGGRSEANQEWLNNKAVALLLQTESAIATLVAEAIDQAIRDYKTQPPPAEPVIEVHRAQPAPLPAWVTVLLAAVRHLVWVAGLYPALFLGWQLSMSELAMWASPVLLCLLWLKWGSSWWATLLPLTVITGEFLFYVIPLLEISS